MSKPPLMHVPFLEECLNVGKDGCPNAGHVRLCCDIYQDFPTPSWMSVSHVPSVRGENRHSDIRIPLPSVPIVRGVSCGKHWLA